MFKKVIINISLIMFSRHLQHNVLEEIPDNLLNALKNLKVL